MRQAELASPAPRSPRPRPRFLWPLTAWRRKLFSRWAAMSAQQERAASRLILEETRL
jgi:hypothetical protein